MKQIRSAMNSINLSTDNPEYQNLLESADLLLNELMLQTETGFYLDYINKGKLLLSEGEQIVTRLGGVVEPSNVRKDLSEASSPEIFDNEIEHLHQALAELVSHLEEQRSAEEKDYLVRLSDWETSLYSRRANQVVYPPKSARLEITREKLQAYLQKKNPQWRGLEIRDFTSLHGGFSKQTVLFDCEDSVNGKQSLVMRADVPVKLLHYDGCDVTREYYMIQLMDKLGLPVAKTRWLEQDTSHFDCNFIVSNKSPGRIRGASMGSSEQLPEGLVDSMLSTFYKMHNLLLDREDPLAIKSHLSEWLPHKTIYETTKHYVNVFIPNEIERTGIKPTPDLIRAVTWLKKNIPECDEPPVILHMDYSFNNLLFDGNQISAILDWETSRLGDPADDIVWTQLSLSNVMDIGEFLRRYREGTGRTISEYRMAYTNVAKLVLNLIGALNSIHCLDSQDNTPIKYTMLGFYYMPILCTQLNSKIAEAERIKSAD
ncbi:MAG: phosphotransferase family protein [Halieaceae bacterium]|nr:phosphotransferase family protein [Halieaceae bacterium]